MWTKGRYSHLPSSTGYVGRHVIRLLAPFAVDLPVFYPLLRASGPAALGVRRVDLTTLFATNRVVSLHAPVTPETRRLIGSQYLSLLPLPLSVLAPPIVLPPGIPDSELSEAQWQRVLPLLPQKQPPRGRPNQDHRPMTAAMTVA